MTRFLWMLPCLVCLPSLQAQQPADIKATIEYVRKLQTSTGGFLSMAPAPNIRLAPTLRATSSGVRALHYLGGEIPDKAAGSKFVASCFDAASGGFADMPKGKPDVFTTAVGIMAVTELKMPLEKYADGTLKYLSENAKGFEDIRIAAAGLERLGRKSPKSADWDDELKRTFKAPDSKPDEPTSGAARLLASFLVTKLRLAKEKADAGTLLGNDYVKASLEVLLKGQRLNGGYGKEGTASSDLETTYRVMRAFVMLKGQPMNLEGMRSFVAKCRNEDGGYGVSPGQPSNISATYFAAIVRHWLKDMK